MSEKIQLTIEPALSTGLSPLVKWPGGKEKELKFILPALPERFHNYYEPFVGGGSVFMAVNAERHFINDLSKELVDFYRCIDSKSVCFFDALKAINSSWKRLGTFANDDNELIAVYSHFRREELPAEGLKQQIARWFENTSQEIATLLPETLTSRLPILKKEILENLPRKMMRMKGLEQQYGQLPPSDVADNVECALKSALYMFYRTLYNEGQSGDMQTALFVFIRNYAYSGMFRFNAAGKFNVPYGGIAYNGKSLDKKLDFYVSTEVANHFASTEISNLDFETFLERKQPTTDDFIFLDPPYDTDFSTYDRNTFSRNDQRRLADYLLTRCQAKWMLIIKHTDFIGSLYNRPGINVRAFEKEYLVSFMNRNDKKAVHLLITNY